MVTMKFSPVKIDEKPAMNAPTRGQHDVRVGCRRGIRRVERPARVHAAQHQRGDAEEAAGHVEVPARQVDAREREVLGADHQRHQEIAEDGRDRRDQEEEHHHHAVRGEDLVVGLGREQVAARRGELQADQHREDAADQEEGRHRVEVQQRDALVVLGEEPGRRAVRGVQVVHGGHRGRGGRIEFVGSDVVHGRVLVGSRGAGAGRACPSPAPRPASRAT